METIFICSNEKTHEDHVCQLRKKGASQKMKELAYYPKVSCLLCEALANSADHVCAPLEID